MDIDTSRLLQRVEWAEANLWRLNEVRNRGFWGRVKWLLTGK